MGDVVIRAEGIGKRYRIGQNQSPYRTLREALNSASLAPLRWLRTIMGAETLRRKPETFWALKDINLEIRQGEVLGVIGRNGAGKSTLLKILARITGPTTGRVQLRGRVGSLLEVGTGFHPELTGRENIYLNGAILGMRKGEIDRRFDEIVAFAEIDRFLDTAVKRYSSGMYVRLAFAVAAHTEPEILLVDEVLAVGDAGFQLKCLGKMGDVAQQGRTVLFVSHNMPAVESLTSRAILLRGGRIARQGDTSAVIQEALNWAQPDSPPRVDEVRRLQHDHGTKIRIRDIRIPTMDVRPLRVGEPIIFSVTVQSRIDRRGVRFGFTILDGFGASILSGFSNSTVELKSDRTSRFQLTLPSIGLAPGSYRVAVSIGEGDARTARVEYDVVRPGPLFTISPFTADGGPIIQWNASSFGAFVLEGCEVSSVESKVSGR